MQERGRAAKLVERQETVYLLGRQSKVLQPQTETRESHCMEKLEIAESSNTDQQTHSFGIPKSLATHMNFTSSRWIELSCLDLRGGLVHPAKT